MRARYSDAFWSGSVVGAEAKFKSAAEMSLVTALETPECYMNTGNSNSRIQELQLCRFFLRLRVYHSNRTEVALGQDVLYSVVKNHHTIFN